MLALWNKLIIWNANATNFSLSLHLFWPSVLLDSTKQMVALYILFVYNFNYKKQAIIIIRIIIIIIIEE